MTFISKKLNVVSALSKLFLMICLLLCPVLVVETLKAIAVFVLACSDSFKRTPDHLNTQKHVSSSDGPNRSDCTATDNANRPQKSLESHCFHLVALYVHLCNRHSEAFPQPVSSHNAPEKRGCGRA